MTKFYLTRWLDTQTSEQLAGDTKNFSACDFVHTPHVLVTTSIEHAKKAVIDAVLNDELLPLDIPEDIRNAVTEKDFSWDDEHLPQYALVFKGDPIVALVYIEPLREFYHKPEGGPT